MPRFQELEYEEHGSGRPLIALHPLALESSAFVGLARHLAPLGFRTLAVDLPGFGRTAAPEGPITPASMAAPLLELVRSLEEPPILLGMSMGGRVALEVGLTSPSEVRGIVGVAPYLPWRKRRAFLCVAAMIDPAWGERIPLERAWPVLKGVTDLLERVPHLEEDWLTRACVRVAYYSTCAATRTSLLSASRELALDPAFGPTGLWDRLPKLRVPSAFVWAGRDRLIPQDHGAIVHEALPSSHQIEAACSGHFVNARHFRCLMHAMALGVGRVVEESDRTGGRRRRTAPTLAPCLAGRAFAGEVPDVRAEPSESVARAGAARR